MQRTSSEQQTDTSTQSLRVYAPFVFYPAHATVVWTSVAKIYANVIDKLVMILRFCYMSGLASRVGLVLTPLLYPRNCCTYTPLQLCRISKGLGKEDKYRPPRFETFLRPLPFATPSSRRGSKTAMRCEWSLPRECRETVGSGHGFLFVLPCDWYLPVEQESRTRYDALPRGKVATISHVVFTELLGT